MTTETEPIALVAGASGMVGTELVRVLVAGGEYRRVIAVSRRPLSIEAPRLANRILRFENLESDLRGVTLQDLPRGGPSLPAQLVKNGVDRPLPEMEGPRLGPGTFQAGSIVKRDDRRVRGHGSTEHFAQSQLLEREPVQKQDTLRGG